MTNGPDKPGKLMKIRSWLTIPEAARYLAILLGEEVTEAEVLRLGLDGQLKLSVRFVNWGAEAKRHREFTEAEQAERHASYSPAVHETLASRPVCGHWS